MLHFTEHPEFGAPISKLFSESSIFQFIVRNYADMMVVETEEAV